jgi:hypothetical protein
MRENQAAYNGGAMKRVPVICSILCLAVTAFAGFKVKLIRPKKPEQFQTRMVTGSVTFAADLVIEGGDQRDYFYRDLISSKIIAVRLAVFNGGNQALMLPLDTLQLITPDGNELQLIAPEIVAEAVLQGKAVSATPQSKPVQVSPKVGNPRIDRTDPRYDPRMDPTDPRYDPRMDPSDPRYDPRMDPNDRRYPRNDPNYDPRNDPQSRRSGYPNSTWGRPGVDVVLNPGGGTTGAISEYEKALVQKDFSDKAHTPEPLEPFLNRDRFLYFVVPGTPASGKGYTLRLPAAKGMPQEILLKF